MFEKLRAILGAAGAGLSVVVDMTSCHIDIDALFDTFERVQWEYMSPPYPAWTAVEVVKLRRRNALVDVRVIARAPDGAPSR